MKLCQKNYSLNPLVHY